MQKWLLIMVVGIMLAVPALAAAQEGAERVEIAATDGLMLVGDLYLPAEPGESGAPAVILLHMLSSTRAAWEVLIDPLVEAGYAVLAVDLRGHGETGGTSDWELADQDTQTWTDWLRQQPGIDPTRISLIGGSIGSNLALRGLAHDKQIVTAIALSPGLDYQGVTTEDAVKATRSPVFIAVAQNDGSASSVKKLAGLIRGEGLVRYYKGTRHGTVLLSMPDLIPTMIFWLDLYNQPGEVTP